MSGIRASQRFDVMSKRLGSRLREHAQETFPPDAQKGLRRFAMREAADLLRLNQNTFRHHVSNLEGFPEGILEGGNRRSFSAEEMVEAQRVLLETGRIKPDEHPHRRAGEPCQVLTIFNLKGGSAKTSTVAHVGQLLGLRGYRVLLIDLDSQASLTNLFGVTPELDPDMPTSYDLIRSEGPLPASDIIRKTNFPTVDLIPASMDIMEYEFEVALSFRHGATTFHSRIREALEPVLDRYDVVIFDTAPTPSLLHGSLYMANDALLYPTKCEYLSFDGLMESMKHRDEASKARQYVGLDEVSVGGIIPTMYRTGTQADDYGIEILKERFGKLVWPEISLRTVWNQASFARRLLFSFAPDTKAASEAWRTVELAEAI